MEDRLSQLEDKLESIRQVNEQQTQELHKLINQNRCLTKRLQILVGASMIGFTILYAQARFEDEDVDQWIARAEKLATIAVGLGVAGGGVAFLAKREES